MTRRSLLLLIPIATAILVSAFALSSQAADRDIMGDWVITGGVTQISGETIDVRGSVLVQDGGILKLDRCTLLINGSEDGLFKLEVDSNGSLEAYNTRIYGSPGRVWIRIHNDSIMRGCTLEHIHASAQERGLMLYNGNISMRDTIIRDILGYGTVVYTNLTFINVTTSEAQHGHMYIINTLLSDDSKVRIEDCHFNGFTSTTGRTMVGVQVACYDGFNELTIQMKNTRIELFSTGVNVGGSGGVIFKAEGCEVVNCYKGFYFPLSGGSVTLKGNVLRQSCVDIHGANHVGVHLEDNIIADYPYGLVCRARWAGVYACSVENLTLRNCTEGAVVTGSAGGGRIDVTIRNSSLESVGTGFVVGERGRVSIYDTKLEVGSGRVTGSNAWIKAYATLDPKSVRWKGGGPIVEGVLIMENETRVRIASVDLNYPTPQTILGWEMTDTAEFAIEHLYPVLTIEGHEFRGDRYDLWSGRIRVIEIIDDVVPEVTIAHPEDMEGINATAFTASGGYSELGSGMASLEYSLDGSDPIPFTDFKDDEWDLHLAGLTEGLHNLTIRGIDAVGNTGNTTSVQFIVDTVVPTIVMTPPPGLVNRTNVTIQGWTEGNSILSVNGVGFSVPPDGAFIAVVELEEGPNILSVRVMDRAGNENRTSFEVVRDTSAPGFKITSPVDGTCTNARLVLVEGIAEYGANVSINGMMIGEADGPFSHWLDLDEGEFPIRICAMDRAGNRAERMFTLFVDWTAPGLTIIQPETALVITRKLEIWINGEVDDASIRNVSINDKVVDLFAGGFARKYLLVEGRNEFDVMVTDAAGNINSAHLIVICDLTPPTYTVDLTSVGGELVTIGGNLYSTTSSVSAHVIIDEEVTVKLRDGTEHPLAKELNISFDLFEGVNDIQFSIVDLAGNEADEYRGQVILDTTTPLIAIFEPLEGETTREDSVVLHGQSEEGSIVTIDGARVQLLPGGEFRLTLALVEGRNDFLVEAEDEMGNSNSTVVTVIKEKDAAAKGGSWAWVGYTVLALVMITALVLAALNRRRRSPPEGDGTGAVQPPSTTHPPSPPPGSEGDSSPPSEWEELE